MYLLAIKIWRRPWQPTPVTLAWKIPWMEEPGGLQSMGSRRVRHDWATSLSLFTFMHWRRKWQPTPVFLPGESQGQRSLMGCRLWGRTESELKGQFDEGLFVIFFFFFFLLCFALFCLPWNGDFYSFRRRSVMSK